MNAIVKGIKLTMSRIGISYSGVKNKVVYVPDFK